MRKNLLAMLLAVVMIAAVVFIAAPNAQAADAPTVITAEAGKTIELTADTIVNLNGLKNVVIDTKGYKVSLIDTGNLDDLSGDAAGTAKVTGTVADWVQHTGGYKYLAVKNEDKEGNITYSAHPFNISITKYGVNTAYSAVSIRVTVIANDVVAKLIDAGEFGLHNYNLANTKNADKEYSPYWKSFKDFTNEEGKYTTHGIHGYFYLENSLTSDVLTANASCKLGAYVKINGKIIDSLQLLQVSPQAILTDLNNKVIDEPTLFSEDQKTKMVELLNKEGNDYLKAYCGNFLPAAPKLPITYTFADYTAGTQYADNEVHKLDDYITVTTTDAHFTSELRLYSSSTYNGYAIIKSAFGISEITFNAGNKVDTLNVYVSNDDGATWDLKGTISVTSTSYKDYTISLDGATLIKLDVAGANQVRIKYMAVTFAQDSGSTEPEPSEPTPDPSEPEECVHTDANSDYKCDSCGEKMLPEDGTTLTIPQALTIGKLYTKDTYTTQKYYITGTITEVQSTTYGNVMIEDADGNSILIYGLYSADGNTRYDAMSYKPVVGDEITVYTVLGYYNAAQGKNAWLDEVVAHEHDWADATCKAPKTCSVCGATDGDPIDHNYVSGVCSSCGKEEGSTALDNATLSFADTAQRTSYSTSAQVWEQNGIKLTNNKSSSTTDVADYAKPARFYANSEIIVEGAGITKIVFDCNSSSYATALKNSIGTVSGATVTVSSDKVTVEFTTAVDSFTIAKLTAQVRMDSITVN